MAAVAWLSVIAKRGVHVVVPSKVIRCCWDDTFAELLSKAATTSTVSNIFMVTIVTKCGYHSNIIIESTYLPMLWVKSARAPCFQIGMAKRLCQLEVQWNLQIKDTLGLARTSKV